MLLNGKPMNDVQSGVVRWDAIPISAIETIEGIHAATIDQLVEILRRRATEAANARAA